MSEERGGIINGPVGLVVFITGLLSSPSGGDVHALRLAEHWGRTRGAVCVIGPDQLRQVLADTRDVTLLTPRVPFEPLLARKMGTYPILCILRAMVYAAAAPRAEWYVASSHFVGDILACLFRRLHHGSSVVYVHHIVKLAGRRRGAKNVLSIAQEAACLAIAKIFDCVLVVDPAATEWLLAHGFDRSRVHQCRNGSSPPAATQLNAKSPHPTILFLGRLTKEKGAHDFIKIVYEATKARAGTVVDMVGDGPLRDELEALATSLGLAVNFHGYVGEAEKWKLLTAAHVVLAPSYEEGWGIAVDEALWAGSEIVCYDLPVFATINESLHCVPVGDVGAAAREVRALLDRPVAPIVRRPRPDRLVAWSEVVEEESVILEHHLQVRRR